MSLSHNHVDEKKDISACSSSEKKRNGIDYKEDDEIVGENLVCYASDKNKEDQELHASLLKLIGCMENAIAEKVVNCQNLINDLRHNRPIPLNVCIQFCRQGKLYIPSRFEELKRLLDHYVRSDRKIKEAALTMLHPCAFDRSGKNFLLDSGMMDKNIFASIFAFLPRQLSYFDKFEDLSSETKSRILTEYKEKRGKQDFDDFSIVTSAIQLLSSFNVPEECLLSLLVGPMKRGEEWSLANQLSLIEKESKFETQIKDKKYLIFTIPTDGGRHTTPVVVSLTDQKIYCLDPRLHKLRYMNPFCVSPMETKMINSQEEATLRLNEAIVSVRFLKGFTVVLPCAHFSGSLQSSSDSINSNIHSAMIIAGIILHREKPTHCPDDIRLDLTTGTGIKAKDLLVSKFVIILQLALRDYAARREKPSPLTVPETQVDLTL